MFPDKEVNFLASNEIRSRTPWLLYSLKREQSRPILGKLARIYDLLGLGPPITLQGKFIYRDACELKQAWDAPLPDAFR